jgi:hypothetical protein
MVSDGCSHITALFFGRRRIPGLTVGRKILLEGTICTERSRCVVYNPLYTLA